jgi:ATP-dependent helicase/nuclease subunit A
MTPLDRFPTSGLEEDARARELIGSALAETLVVEAAAGTGKTTELVNRIVAVLRSGLARVDQIVAVTFTHKAAGELKVRLRQRLDEARQEAGGGERAHLENAIQHIEEASIGTIHSFCTQILRERPVEAGVDPAFEDLAEAEQRRLYFKVFRGWLERALDEPRAGLHNVLTRLAWTGTGKPADELRFAGWKLIQWRDFRGPWRRDPFDRDAEVDRLVPLVTELAKGSERCERRSDELYRALAPARELVTWVARAGPRLDYDTLEALLIKLLRDLNRDKRKGRGPFGNGISREEVLKSREALLRLLASFQEQANADLAAQLQADMQDLIDAYEDRKRSTGKLDFMDLLIKARDLLRDNREVRSFLLKRFTRIFVDEFQDTDPLQIEILLLLAGSDEETKDWRQIALAPGKLFVVGDPKQSIYRFRRADVGLYQEVRDRLLAGGARLLHLSRSFRAPAPIQECINAAFSGLMQEDPHTAQAQYVPLLGGGTEIPGQPSVIALPAPVSWTGQRITKKAINECLPDAICAFIEWLLASGWKVRDVDDPERLIRIESRHIAVLFRRVVNFREDMARPYVRGLEAREIPHLLVASKTFYEREEVETLGTASTAIEWPDDELAVYATLRGPLFAVPDARLLRYRQEFAGRLHPLRPGPTEVPEVFRPVTAALRILADLHRERNRRPVAATLDALLDATRARIGFALRPGGHQVLSNVNCVVELARSFEQTGGISFRGFADELRERADGYDSAEPPVIEEGAEGVRLLTVHAAKGLEFPVVILADMTANLSARNPDRYVDPARQVCATRLIEYAPFEWLNPRDLTEQIAAECGRESAEGVRVAYVAVTRARDLLVVPAVGNEQVDGWLAPLNPAIYPAAREFRNSRPALGCPPFGNTTLLAGPDSEAVRPGLHRPKTGRHEVVWWDPAALRLNVESKPSLRTLDLLQGEGTVGSAAYRVWQQRRAQSIETGSRPTWQVWNPSELREAPPGESILVEREVVADRPARPRGPGFGSLVHAVFGEAGWSGERVGSLARTHGRILGATVEEIDIAREVVLRALEHPLMVRAKNSSRAHREMPVLLRIGDGKAIEGIIDVLFREDSVWHIVDFKTDLEVEVGWAQYKRQIQWYGRAVADLTASPIACHILFV